MKFIKNLKYGIEAMPKSIGMKLLSKDSRIVYFLLGCVPNAIAKKVVLPATPMCTKRILEFIKNPEVKGQTHLGKVDSLSISVVPTGIGCPSTAIVLEALHSADVATAIRVDFIGSLRDNIEIGDIIIADSAFKGDGTTSHYMEGEKIEANSELTSLLIQKSKEYGKNAHVGPVWTTDTLFRQTPELYKKAVGKGCIGIDMECSAIFTLGKIYDMKTAAIMVVSDKPVTGKSFYDAQKFASELLQGLDDAIKITINTIKSIKENI
jgi:uridine phosphorylase